MVVAKNPLLLSFLTAAAAFAAFSLLVEHPWVAFTGAGSQLAFGALVSWYYTLDAGRAVLNPRHRNSDAPTSHNLVIGTALLAWGQIYAGVASISFIVSGSPEEWLANPLFYGSRYITAGGFWFLYKAVREEPRAFLSFRPPLALLIAFLIMAAAMFALGLRVGAHAPTVFEGSVYQGAATYPQCASNETVWVSSNGLYHKPDSPDRLKILGPKRCFRTAAEAEREGFRQALR